jgi:1-acyl-sn-glycerol-3-phosphate acyltransferase
MAGLLERFGYARSLFVTAPLVFIATATMGSISLASSLIDSTGRLQHACARVWARIILSVCRVHLTVTGSLPPPGETPYVFLVNHQSHMDIPVVLAALPLSFRFAAKKELFRIPFLGWHLRRSGHIPVDRKNPHAAVKAFRSAGSRLRAGTSLVFFPEGGTSLDGGIKPFKSGGFVLAEQSQADVVPVTIRGSRAVLVPKTYYVRGGPIAVTLGSPISTKGHSLQELTERVRTEILSTFEHGKTPDRHTDTIPG